MTDEFGGLGTFVAVDHSRSVYPVLDPRFHEGSLARRSLRWVYGSSATGVVWFCLYNRSSLCLLAVALWSGAELARLLYQMDLGVHPCSASFLSLGALLSKVRQALAISQDPEAFKRTLAKGLVFGGHTARASELLADPASLVLCAKQAVNLCVKENQVSGSDSSSSVGRRDAKNDP